KLTIQGGGGTLGEDHNALVNNATIMTSGVDPSLNRPNALQVLNVDNRGTIRARDGAALTLLTVLTTSTWTNRGTIDSENASLTLDGRFTSAGRISATNSAVSLRGTFTLADLGAFNRTGGTVELTGTLNNQDTTLELDDSTGPWRLSVGTIRGGT